MRKGSVYAAVGILALALVLRLGLAVAVDTPLVRGHDPSDYVAHGRGVAAGDGYPERLGRPSALRPPLYPLYLALVFKLAPRGAELKAAQLGQALIGTVAVALVGVAGARVWGRRAGLAAALLAAVYPPLLMIGATLMSEALLVPLVVATVLALLKQQASGSARWAFGAGALVGLAALARANAIVLLLPALFGVWRKPRLSARSLAAAATLVAAAAIVIFAWSLRNFLVFQRVVPLTTQGGITLAGTYNDVSAGDRRFPASWHPPSAVPGDAAIVFDPRLSEADVERQLRARAFAYISGHPAYVLEVGWWNSLRLLELQPGWSRLSANLMDIRSRDLVAASRFSFYLVLLVAIFGVGLGFARGLPSVLWTVPLLLLLSVVFVQSEPRFRLPIDPFVVMVAGATLTESTVRGHSRRDRRPS